MKRLIDILVSGTALLVLLPVMVVVAVGILVNMGLPVLFSQERPGYKSSIFRLRKFRTMRASCDEIGELLSDEQRLTVFGNLLRSTSLDELPTLWNVLKGDMSLVGPRPLLVEYLQHYTPEQMRRHDVRPGITGWAQVNGRNALSWDEKFKLDVWYVDNQSLLLDLRIIGMTFGKVFRSEGISHPGEATMTRFTGSDTSDSGENGSKAQS